MYFYARRMADIFVVSGPIQALNPAETNSAPTMPDMPGMASESAGASGQGQ